MMQLEELLLNPKLVILVINFLEATEQFKTQDQQVQA
jgi:hypothetical protein